MLPVSSLLAADVVHAWNPHASTVGQPRSRVDGDGYGACLVLDDGTGPRDVVDATVGYLTQVTVLPCLPDGMGHDPARHAHAHAHIGLAAGRSVPARLIHGRHTAG